MFRYLQPEIQAHATRLGIDTASADHLFDLFLDMISAHKDLPPHRTPYGLRFATHVNSMWNDVVDEEGNVIIRYIFRLEDIDLAVEKVLTECGHHGRSSKGGAVNENATSKGGLIGSYVPSSVQEEKIASLYAKDWLIYDKLAHRF